MKLFCAFHERSIAAAPQLAESHRPAQQKIAETQLQRRQRQRHGSDERCRTRIHPALIFGPWSWQSRSGRYDVLRPQSHVSVQPNFMALGVGPWWATLSTRLIWFSHLLLFYLRNEQFLSRNGCRLNLVAAVNFSLCQVGPYIFRFPSWNKIGSGNPKHDSYILLIN